MSTGLSRYFDPERLAAHGTVLAGVLDTDSMPRLREALASNEPVQVRIELRAQRDDARRLLLTGQAQAALPLTCQRCMEQVMHDASAQFALAIVHDDEAARALPADLDPLLLERGAEVDLPVLIEDELLLALPAIPMHGSEEACGERAQYGRKTDEAFEGAARENPFAVLKKLKNGKT